MLSDSQIQELISQIKTLGELSLLLRKKGLDIEIKEDSSPVTNVDKVINERAIEFLHSKFPSFGIVSEELDKEWKDINWFVDPINGTKAYLKGKNENWNMLFGLVEGNSPIFGAIYYPYANKLQVGGSMIEAVEIQESGTKHKLRVEKNPEFKSMLLCPSDNWYMAWNRELGDNPEYELVKYDQVGEWEDTSVVIAKNKANLLMNKNWGAWGTWDIAAGHAVLSAAGGVTTDFLGNDIDYLSGQSMLPHGFNYADSIERIRRLPWYGVSKEEYEGKFEIKDESNLRDKESKSTLF